MTTTNTHAAPWTFRRFLADMILKPTPNLLQTHAGTWSNPAVLTGREPDLDLPELLVARWHGYTPAQWLALPALVKVDKRESHFQAQGL